MYVYECVYFLSLSTSYTFFLLSLPQNLSLFSVSMTFSVIVIVSSIFFPFSLSPSFLLVVLSQYILFMSILSLSLSLSNTLSLYLSYFLSKSFSLFSPWHTFTIFLDSSNSYYLSVSLPLSLCVPSSNCLSLSLSPSLSLISPFIPLGIHESLYLVLCRISHSNTWHISLL